MRSYMSPLKAGLYAPNSHYKSKQTFIGLNKRGSGFLYAAHLPFQLQFQLTCVHTAFGKISAENTFISWKTDRSCNAGLSSSCLYRTANTETHHDTAFVHPSALKSLSPCDKDCKWSLNTPSCEFILGFHSLMWSPAHSLPDISFFYWLINFIDNTVEKFTFFFWHPLGMALTLLEMTLKVAGVAYIPTFTKIYQSSLNWLPGLVFLISSIITVLAMIPIRYAPSKATEQTVSDEPFVSHSQRFSLCRFLKHRRLHFGSEQAVREDSGRLKKQHTYKQWVLF